MESNELQDKLLTVGEASIIVTRLAALVGLLLSLRYFPGGWHLASSLDRQDMVLAAAFLLAPSVIFMVAVVYAGAIGRTVVPPGFREKHLSFSDPKGLELVLIACLGLWVIVESLPQFMAAVLRAVIAFRNSHPGSDAPFGMMLFHLFQLSLGMYLILQARGIQALIRRLRGHGT